MTSKINNPFVSHCFLSTLALKGMEPAPNLQLWGGSKKLEGGSFKFVMPVPKHGGNDSTAQGKTYKNKKNHTT